MTKYIKCNEDFVNKATQACGPCTTAVIGITELLEQELAADVIEVKHGKWETVHGVLTPGGDPLKRCPYCKSRESEHLDGVEHPSRWMFCPICGVKMDLEEGAN